MENSNKSIENLIEKAEAYTRTTFKLYKYEALNKSAEIVSDLAVKFVLAIVIIMSSFFINVGISLWIGEKLDNDYYGFFIVAFVYLCFAFLIYIFREKWVKSPVSNFFINKMKN
jgi:hypothetical protein